MEAGCFLCGIDRHTDWTCEQRSLHKVDGIGNRNEAGVGQFHELGKAAVEGMSETLAAQTAILTARRTASTFAAECCECCDHSICGLY